MTGGFLVAGVGIWLLCQVFGGNALDRVGITGRGKSQDSEATDTPASNAGSTGGADKARAT